VGKNESNQQNFVERTNSETNESSPSIINNWYVYDRTVCVKRETEWWHIQYSKNKAVDILSEEEYVDNV
jgi:hypothetical protein